MKFNKWYIPGKRMPKNYPQVRISNSFIGISKYCIDEYFKEKTKARIGYDKEANKLYIMPTQDKDEFGLKLIGRKDDNFKYLNAKNFIAEEKLSSQTKRKSNRYQCSWDEQNGCIVVENVK